MDKRIRRVQHLLNTPAPPKVVHLHPPKRGPSILRRTLLLTFLLAALAVTPYSGDSPPRLTSQSEPILYSFASTYTTPSSHKPGSWKYSEQCDPVIHVLGEQPCLNDFQPPSSDMLQ